MPPAPTLRLVGPPDEDPPRGDLPGRVAAGDRRAKEQLFREHVQFVGHVARAAGAGSELEDVVQDTFLEAFSSLGTLQHPSALRPWLARLTVRQVQRRTRWRPWLGLFRGPREEAQAWERLVEPGASPEVLVAVRQAQQALQRHGESVALCWLLRHWHGLTLEETAEAAGVSLATAKRRLQVAEAAIAAHREEASPP